jgi:hypothetical protein
MKDGTIKMGGLLIYVVTPTRTNPKAWHEDADIA